MPIHSNLSTLMGSRRYSIKDVHEKNGAFKKHNFKFI
jgi:hypothetical protein